MGQCLERWPRTNESRRYEVFGDLLELALARGYSDADMEHLVHDISAIGAFVKEAYNVMAMDNPLHNRPFAVHLAPSPFADVLLCAGWCHRHRDFRRLHAMFSSPDLVRPR